MILDFDPLLPSVKVRFNLQYVKLQTYDFRKNIPKLFITAFAQLYITVYLNLPTVDTCKFFFDLSFVDFSF